MSFKKLCRLTTLTLLLTAQTALAQSTSAPPEAGAGDAKRAEGRARYEQGADAYAKGRFTDAIELFLQADALAPSAALSFNIARSYEKIGDTALSLRWYRDFRRRAPDAKNAAEVSERIRALEAALAKKGVQQLTVMSSPEGATVVIDDQPVGVTPFTGQFPPGRHRVVLSLKGHREAAQDLDLSAERSQDLRVSLTVAPADAVGAPTSAGGGASRASASRDVDPSKARFGPWPWVGLGAGVVTLGVAGGFELARRSAEDDAKGDTTQVGYKEKLDRANSRQTTARVLGAVGGALVLTGGVLLVIDLSSRGPKDEPRASMGLGCVPEGCAFSASGRF